MDKDAHQFPEVDPLKVPAFMRKRSLSVRDRQKLLFTALDRKQAGLLKQKRKRKGKIVPISRMKVGFRYQKGRLQKISKRKKTGRRVVESAGKWAILPAPRPVDRRSITVAARRNVPQTPRSNATEQNWPTPVLPLMTSPLEELPISKDKTVLQSVGIVTYYYPRIQVGVIRLSATVRRGDQIMVGKERQLISSLQINHRSVKQGVAGGEVGVKLDMVPVVGDVVYKVVR